ncbi:bifunctional UDP-N-acetylmuramoyl-L-alanyl-D-glutamate--2,6-diaminopimelate ligase MurE/UDP-N-acetylmuramoyl-tripeptide--D-alanyl-D-alanine ligase MurF [Candidatus Pelagibacter giovannonii]|uniref:Multifunctional fusion protein n=1 Tax=Candidatus Pelagibacter giovannonii TaxID=2563896 RepID=A0A6H1Q360_9PROT|nr:bifunctional UDP-N-acetylmuramoyl-L-alanyl-D-glutamate--2,6-diaminopimelate ligase MurE/UDP-N-acetylmuramoyl-tripeptide--D-alanyl-D-alanine ligase MurF [Candidatus Pelagibacter giovannonii]QIZ21372.1 bifunctional UDP-N-acetylmuramoyl-L-alanyl-D-glutamate--2,6-diaminopimelate ligase MurE/UDP-N-acetylmuramoyl-tripeptide--D-alanyl-D-alanine ligase MurF [Candidatus Pelagibacter giovannonii]
MLIGSFLKNIKKEVRNHRFAGLSFNSADCKKDYIFFAIKGTKSDGNKFIDHAIIKGAKIIISEQKFEGIKNKVLFLRSKNVRKLLSELSYKITKNKPKNLIAVTGTNGKSSIADFYFQLLNLSNKKVASIGTLGIRTKNNLKNVSNTTLDPIGLSKILNDLKKQRIDNVILEASSHGLKQNRLDGLKFNTAIFTNLSHDHLDYHKTFNDYLKSKLYLFEKLLKPRGSIITDSQIPEYKNLKKISLNNKFNLQVLSKSNNGIDIYSHKFKDDKQIIEITHNQKNYKLQTDLIGRIQLKNLFMAMLAAKKSNLKFDKIVKLASSVKSVSGRFEKIGTLKNKSKVILDYAHTPDALNACLSNLKEQFENKRIFIVFGCGGNRDKDKRPMMGKIANQYCDRVYLTDDNPRNENPQKIRLAIKKTIDKSKIFEIASRSKAIHKAISDLNTGDILVIAGKGHEQMQDYGKFVNKFSDRLEILHNIKLKNKILSTNLKINILKEISNSPQINSNIKINNASINSKTINKNDIFFAIKGNNKDGNSYVNEAFQNGASLIIANNQKKSKKKIIVDNTLQLLTEASLKLRENLSSKIISITGSCGKTSLKELLGKTLSKISNVTYSPKSFNNKFGVPLSLFNLRENDEFGVFEIGMDKKGEIDYLSKIIKPDVGVITNISYAHIKNFKNIHQVALAKSEIINNIKINGFLVLNKDDKFYNLHKKIAKKKKINILSFGLKNKSADIFLKKIVKEKSKYKIFVNINKKQTYFYVRSIFENNLKNLLAAIAIISIYKDTRKLDKNIFFDYEITKGRGDIIKIRLNKKSIFIVDESYNSNPLSLKSAIKNFDELKIDNTKKKLILGDMLELGNYSKKLHLEIGKDINKTSLKNINVMGKHILYTYKNLDKHRRGVTLKDNSKIIDLIKNDLNNNDYLMIKGSNSTGLNNLVKKLKTGKFNAL